MVFISAQHLNVFLKKLCLNNFLKKKRYITLTKRFLLVFHQHLPFFSFSFPPSPISVRSAQHCAQASASSPHLSASVWAWQRTGGSGGEFGLLPLLWTSWILWLLGWLCGCARPCKPSEPQQPPITGQYHLM